MNIQIEVQNASTAQNIPTAAALRQWAILALTGEISQAELTLRIVDEAESAMLNEKYRKIAKPTNVLSFPLDIAEGPLSHLLGDIVLCAPLIAREAQEQVKTIEAHWAHLVIHGVLHLRGFDHIKEEEAQVMEAKEIGLLKQLGFTDPYEGGNNNA